MARSACWYQERPGAVSECNVGQRWARWSAAKRAHLGSRLTVAQHVHEEDATHVPLHARDAGRLGA